MANVRKCFDPVKVKFHKHSNDTVVKYSKSYDGHFNSIYQKTGEESISKYINSFKSSCSLEDLLKRCSLMPITDKVKMCQQVPTFSGSEVGLPRDLTEAFEQLSELKRTNPDLCSRIQSGEDFQSILKSFIPNKEVINNGSNESSNE